MSMIHKREEWGKDLESENFEGCYWLNSLGNHSGWGNVDCVSLKRGCFFSSVQFSGSVVSDSATPWTAARQASLAITSSQSLLKLIASSSST